MAKRDQSRSLHAKDKNAIEGRNAIIEALKAGMPIEFVMMARDLKPDRSIDLLRKLASEQEVAIKEVSRHELDSLSERGSHQGVIALAAPYPFALLDEVLDGIVDEVVDGVLLGEELSNGSGADFPLPEIL